MSLCLKPGLEENRKLRALIQKILRGDKPEHFCILLIERYAPHCGDLMDFWKNVANTDFSGSSNINFSCCSSLPWIREWNTMQVWSQINYSIKQKQWTAKPFRKGAQLQVSSDKTVPSSTGHDLRQYRMFCDSSVLSLLLTQAFFPWLFHQLAAST